MDRHTLEYIHDNSSSMAGAGTMGINIDYYDTEPWTNTAKILGPIDDDDNQQFVCR